MAIGPPIGWPTRGAVPGIQYQGTLRRSSVYRPDAKNPASSVHWLAVLAGGSFRRSFLDGTLREPGPTETDIHALWSGKKGGGRGGWEMLYRDYRIAAPPGNPGCLPLR